MTTKQKKVYRSGLTSCSIEPCVIWRDVISLKSDRAGVWEGWADPHGQAVLTIVDGPMDKDNFGELGVCFGHIFPPYCRQTKVSAQTSYH